MILHRAHALRTAFLGYPVNELVSHVDAIKEIVEISQLARVNSAITESIAIYPLKQGYFTVSSGSEDSNEYSIDIYYKQSKSCSCQDFLYNIDKDKNHMCKHLWKAHILIILNFLPTVTNDLYEWSLAELNKDIEFLQTYPVSQRRQSCVEQMKIVINQFQKETSESLNYRKYMILRANILSQILNVSD
jgi:hypothetical protein